MRVGILFCIVLYCVTENQREGLGLRLGIRRIRQFDQAEASARCSNQLSLTLTLNPSIYAKLGHQLVKRLSSRLYQVHVDIK